jgi:hypothetical protein
MSDTMTRNSQPWLNPKLSQRGASLYARGQNCPLQLGTSRARQDTLRIYKFFLVEVRSVVVLLLLVCRCLSCSVVAGSNPAVGSSNPAAR